MTYPEAIKFLYGLQLFGARPGLETTRRLAAMAGNPQHQLRFIHVAGTNGKGSTCAMLESIYRASGLRVGLYTSPHLVSFRERIQVNRELIPEDDVVRFVCEAQSWLSPFDAGQHPTFFEIVTVIALRHFAEQKCDLVIWETGLGGRLDATNIVTPLASVITNVQFDHEQWLGRTLEEIAREKAGIIKPRVPVITAAEGDALEVIQETSRRLIAPLHVVRERHAPYSIPLAGEHQRLNAAVAITAVETLRGAIPVTSEAMKRGLESVEWPARFQVLHRGAQTIVLDGAHNPAGAEALATSLHDKARGRPITLILGILEDKNWEQMCRTLAVLATKNILVPVASRRSASPERVAAACAQANRAGETLVRGSLAQALASASHDPFVVITGSLYLVGEAMELLGLAPGAGERELNEWGAPPR